MPLALFAPALAAVLWLAVEFPPAAIALPVVLALGAAVWRLRTVPLAPLLGILLLAALAFNRSEGISIIQIVFGACYLPYLAGWYVLRLAVYRERLVRHVGEAALAFFLLYLIASLGLGLLHGADPFTAFREWVALSLFAFYFPVREACERYDRGPLVILGVVLFMGLVTFAQNTITLYETFSGATYAWQVARARATSNEMMLLAAALLSLTVGATVRRKRLVAAAALGFGVFAVGVVLTQWRAYYVSLALGVALLAWLLSGRERVRVVFLTVGAACVGAALAYLLAGDLVVLLAYGLIDRLLSIGTAASADVSFINRLFESRAAWDRIVTNPVLGHGLGTTFGFFDITTNTTWVKSYVHNGYLSFWFKYGAVGLGALLVFWGYAIRDGLRARHEAAWSRRVAAIFAVAFLLCLIPSFSVSAPLTTGDTVITFTLGLALAAGAKHRAPQRLR